MKKALNKLRIIINSSTQRFGGSVQVALSFINECRSFPENEYHVWVGPGLKKSLIEEDFPDNFEFYHFDFGVIDLLKTRVIQKTLEPIATAINPDVIIATSGPTYFKTETPQIIGFNLPLYIYPESPFIQGLNFKQRAKLLLRKKAHYYFFGKEATAYVTQTTDVEHRVKKAFPNKKVFTVTNTYSNYYVNYPSLPPKLPERKPDEFRLLTISSYYMHKNLELIPEIVRILRNRNIHNIRFVVTLKDEDYHRIFGEMPEVINVGPIRPEECPSLYQECDVMFLPTLAECFSASYPEAMIMRKPIITTDLGFARSICGKAALYYRPQDPLAAAEKILQLIDNDPLKAKLVKFGLNQLDKFDSARTRAEKYLKICKEIASDK